MKAAMDDSSRGEIYAPGLDSYSQELLKGQLMTKERWLSLQIVTSLNM